MKRLYTVPETNGFWLGACALLCCPFFGLTLSEPAAAGSQAEMKLLIYFDPETDALILDVANMGPDPCTIDGRLALGSSPPYPVEVTMEVVDRGGVKHPFSAKIRIGPPAASELVDLRPGQTVGKIFPIDDLAGSFSLKPGEYRVRARYKGLYRGLPLENRQVPGFGPTRLFRGELTSNWVTINVR